MPGEDDGVQAQLAELARRVGQLQLTMLALIDLLRRPAVHLSVEHLDVDRFEFHIDTIDVDQLSGEMNIGMTAQFKGGGVGGGGNPGDQGSGQGSAQSPPRAEPPIRTIWPPGKEEGKPKGEQTNAEPGS